MASTLKYIIDKQPNFVKKIAYKVIPFRYRYGKKFNDFTNLINEAKFWSFDRAKEYQLLRLREILIYSMNNVPFYTKLFKQIGFDPLIKKLDDICVLPVLTKDIINANSDLMLSTTYFNKKYKMSTSGTTGKRLTIYGTDDLFKIEAAFILNAYRDHGANLYDDHSVWIRRYSPQEGDPIFINDYELNRSYMSAFHLNDKTIFSYVDYLNHSKSKILVSYPSTIYYLAVLCAKYDLKLKFIRAIHGASEVCLPQWRKLILEVFGVPIKMHYGQVEKVSFAHQDIHDDLYRENLLYSFNEFGDDGNVIGTGFYNYAMPLIRYQTNDRMVLLDEPTSDSAFPKNIKDILGRNGDMLLTETNSSVPAVNFYSFMSKVEQVDMFQIIQKKETKEVDFYIVPNEKYDKEVENFLIQEMKNRLGNTNVNIIKVKSLTRDINSGKLKTVNLI